MTTKAEIDIEIIQSINPELSEFIEGTTNVANNALSSVVPILGIVTSLINDIFTIHENTQFNKKISRFIINRIASVETIIKSLKSPTKYREKFQVLQHQESFVKFQSTLSKIKLFVETVTQLRAFETFLRATSIKKSMNDLNFMMIIVFNEQRRIDNDILTDTLTKMIKEPPLSRKSDRRGKLNQIIKKVYKDSIEVACKSRDSENRRFRRELLVLEKLDECKSIRKFYGLSEVDDKKVMIFEWAEMGNLKEVYNRERISWNLKAQKFAKGSCF
ncbi:17429_t:CDS:2 [Dentiscutata erythropus]|uniref:17429_t:CDS:1 n=1 Tax=Dentiscutata erythropus TaxID=1348616 RepID=A0A9N9J6K4_9GLOM|nr:17429_t:CDS:2 [Dentiscutata erythropus]